MPPIVSVGRLGVSLRRLRPALRLRSALAVPDAWRAHRVSISTRSTCRCPRPGSRPAFPRQRRQSGLDPEGRPVRRRSRQRHGLQRLTNFNRPAGPGLVRRQVPSIFVSPEDIVWNENRTTAAAPARQPVLPDFRLSTSIVQAINGPQAQVTTDWRFTWMVTAQQNNTSNGAAFDGNIVVFENRPFAIAVDNVPGGRRDGRRGGLRPQHERGDVDILRQRRATAPAPTGPCSSAGSRPSPTRPSRSATGSPT